jgi:hypothetical protein
VLSDLPNWSYLRSLGLTEEMNNHIMRFVRLLYLLIQRDYPPPAGFDFSMIERQTGTAIQIIDLMEAEGLEISWRDIVNHLRRALLIQHDHTGYHNFALRPCPAFVANENDFLILL